MQGKMSLLLICGEPQWVEIICKLAFLCIICAFMGPKMKKMQGKSVVHKGAISWSALEILWSKPIFFQTSK